MSDTKLEIKACGEGSGNVKGRRQLYRKGSILSERWLDHLRSGNFAFWGACRREVIIKGKFLALRAAVIVFPPR